MLIVRISRFYPSKTRLWAGRTDAQGHQGACLRHGGCLAKSLPESCLIANVVVNLNKGAVSAAPIATSVGWQLIKLEDKRKFQPPTFEESKPLLLRSLQANQQNEYVQKLVKAAKVEDK